MTQFINIQAEIQIPSQVCVEITLDDVKRTDIRDTYKTVYRLLNNHNVCCFSCSQDEQMIQFRYDSGDFFATIDR